MDESSEMAVQLPRRFTQAWIERHVPTLSRRDAELVVAAMRAKGWTEEQLAARVFPHLRGTAAAAASASPAPPAAAPPTPSPPPPRRRRRPTLAELSAVIGILGSLAGVAALFGPFGGGDGKATPSPKAPTARGQTAASARAQDALLSHVPLAVRSTCAADERLRKKYNAVAELQCALPGTDQVVYLRYASKADMSRAYRPTPVALDAGPCGESWGVESGYRHDSKTDVGLLKCYTYKGRAWLQWTRDELLIYAYSSQSDGDRKKLFRAWLTAGPNA